HEYYVTEEEGYQNLPFVDFRVGVEGITDTALVRVEHVWAAPDNNNMAPYIDEISDRHYWTVEGVWSPELHLDARVVYQANDDGDLDWNISGITEENMMLVWRPDASEPWINYYDYEINTGNIFNGGGTVAISLLRKGQYALANGDVAAALLETEGTSLKAFPNPTTDFIQVDIPLEGDLIVIALNGQQVLSQKVSPGLLELPLIQLQQGNYQLILRDPKGLIIANESFQVIR
ncbi:MAG: T9SS type A sorting domain-containing protein, partial [Bacteroidota bacterium]